MPPLADRITDELRMLIGEPINDCWRAMDMQIFEFGPRHQTRNRKGELVEVSDIRLHIQCRWRLVDANSILFGRDDLRHPANESVAQADFDQNNGTSVLDVVQRAWFDAHRPTMPVVQDASGDPYGGYRIGLSGGFALETFPCDTRRGRHCEHWRLLGHRTDDKHFVVTGNGAEDDL